MTSFDSIYYLLYTVYSEPTDNKSISSTNKSNRGVIAGVIIVVLLLLLLLVVVIVVVSIVWKRSKDSRTYSKFE